MNWTEVESSLITHVAYEGTTLYARFKGGNEYAYDAVPQQVYDEFMQAESKGKFFMRNIKGKFADRKITK
jgi:hypothetical protein